LKLFNFSAIKSWVLYGRTEYLLLKCFSALLPNMAEAAHSAVTVLQTAWKVTAVVVDGNGMPKRDHDRPFSMGCWLCRRLCLLQLEQLHLCCGPCRQGIQGVIGSRRNRAWLRECRLVAMLSYLQMVIGSLSSGCAQPFPPPAVHASRIAPARPMRNGHFYYLWRWMSIHNCYWNEGCFVSIGLDIYKKP